MPFLKESLGISGEVSYNKVERIRAMEEVSRVLRRAKTGQVAPGDDPMSATMTAQGFQPTPFSVSKIDRLVGSLDAILKRGCADGTSIADFEHVLRASVVEIQAILDDLSRSGQESALGDDGRREAPAVHRAIRRLLAELLDSEMMSREITDRLYECIREAGCVVVPQSPTKKMLEAAWADALAEDAAGVWSSMIAASE